jgi:predicted Zn-dependent protease
MRNGDMTMKNLKMSLIMITFFFLCLSLNTTTIDFGREGFTIGGLPAQSYAGEFDDLNLISVEDEIELGKDLSREVEKKYPLYPDSEVQRYVNDLGFFLSRYAPNEYGIPMTVKVVTDEEVNAFTVPGGTIYLNSGLFKKVDTEAELAGVIAHEMGHAVKRHGTQQLTRMYGINLLLGLFFGENTAEWKYVVADLFSSVGLLAYGRDAEFDADRLAVKIVNKAGYNPNEFLIFLYKLKEMEEDEPTLLVEFLSTHPDIDERIEKVKRVISKTTSVTSRPIINTARFDYIKPKIR